MSKPTLADLPPRYQEQIRAQLARTPKPRTVAIEPAEKPRATIRQDSRGMNKTEARFYEWLKSTDEAANIHREVALPLANGVRYKVDFLVHYSNGFRQICGYEVKGFARDDAIVKLKVAARVYPWVRFYLVRAGLKDAYQQWHFEEVYP